MSNGKRTKEPRYQTKKSNGVKFLVIALIVIVIIAGVLLALKISKKGQIDIAR